MDAFKYNKFNTILYCKKFAETVKFYRDILKFPVVFEKGWFTEFKITETSYVSIADEKKTSVKSSNGAGITLTFNVNDIDKTWNILQKNGIKPGSVMDHPWFSRCFYIFDPEGNRIEFWSENN